MLGCFQVLLSEGWYGGESRSIGCFFRFKELEGPRLHNLSYIIMMNSGQRILERVDKGRRIC